MKLTPAGQELVNTLAKRYAISTDAVTTLLIAVAKGNGSMAQFNHPELGGMGQWMKNGMSMVGDMFNTNLKHTVEQLAMDLSNALASSSPLFEETADSKTSDTKHSSSTWWPSELGSPSSSGAQNDIQYAFFPAKQRLALKQGSTVSLYDTKDHQISGVSQQQDGTGYSLTFTSQHGLVKVEQLSKVK